MKKFKPGDRVAIPAQDHNLMVDAAQDFLRRQRDLGAAGGVPFVDAGIVKVKNSSGADRSRFEVLGLGDAIYDSEKPGFKEEVALIGEEPSEGSHWGKFAVLLEKLPDGKISLAVAQGLVQVQVDIRDATHDYCDVKDGDATQLQTAYHGSARLLYRAGDSGTQWCIVRIGDARFRYGAVFGQVKGAIAAGDTSFTMDHVVPMLGDTPVEDEDEELSVQHITGLPALDDAAAVAWYDGSNGLWRGIPFYKRYVCP